MSIKMLLKVSEEELDKNLGKEVVAITLNDYPMRGILKHNDSIIYDECKYKIEDINDPKKSYMFNAEELKVVNIRE